MKSLSALLLSTLASLTIIDADVRKPNFVFIYTDDQRWDAMGHVQREQGDRARFPWFETPAMDRLAAEGVRFRNAFVTLALCSPSRAAFLTGRYNHMNGVKSNSAPMPADAATHASVLRGNGYRTAYFGKWHMGKQRERPGFDHAASFIGQGIHLDYLRHVKGADENLGRILDALDELKIAEDTVVVYSSDNGRPMQPTECPGDPR